MQIINIIPHIQTHKCSLIPQKHRYRKHIFAQLSMIIELTFLLYYIEILMEAFRVQFAFEEFIDDLSFSTTESSWVVSETSFTQKLSFIL